jgi:hypothetical protein
MDGGPNQARDAEADRLLNTYCRFKKTLDCFNGKTADATITPLGD